MTSNGTTDAGIGYTILLALLALAGALGMYLLAGGTLAAWGFALAMVAGALAVTAPHLETPS